MSGHDRKTLSFLDGLMLKPPLPPRMAAPEHGQAHSVNPKKIRVMKHCRPGCGACCTAPSITSPIPGMPLGKPAAVPCIQLDEAMRCRLFGQPGRPQVCRSLEPSAEMCGSDRAHAWQWLTRLEAQTQPAPRPASGFCSSSLRPGAT